GTLFFDEIGEIPPDVQSALLRVVQEREFRRLGGPLIKFKGRFVFATNRYLPDAVAEGNFREDLHYRIAQVKISLPPLRERRDDIPLLLNHFLAVHQQPRHNGLRPAKSFDADVYREVPKMPLRGNVRDIQRIVRGGLAKSRGDIIGLFDLPEDLLHGAAQPPITTMPQPILDELSKELPSDWEALKYEAAERVFNRVYLKLLLDRHPNKSEAAEAADFARKTLYNLLRKYGLAGGAEDEADES
ncbi:MAG TPA: sigma 54-interacting transcriptional regulator, partial [Blastocatellia bacterium]|nr:sigma 54-interacting transcriptional regulator [Blastocatellia bacterium]